MCNAKGLRGIVRDKMSQQVGDPRTEWIKLSRSHRVEHSTLTGQLENIWSAGTWKGTWSVQWAVNSSEQENDIILS